MLDGGAVRLPYIVGLSRALDLIMTGRPVSAQEAHSMGLVNRVVPKGKAVEEAITLAKKIASFSAGAMRVDRKTAYYSMFNADSFYDALTYEYRKDDCKFCKPFCLKRKKLFCWWCAGQAIGSVRIHFSCKWFI